MLCFSLTFCNNWEGSHSELNDLNIGATTVNQITKFKPMDCRLGIIGTNYTIMTEEMAKLLSQQNQLGQQIIEFLGVTPLCSPMDTPWRRGLGILLPANKLNNKIKMK